MVARFKHQRLRIETDKQLEELKEIIEFYEDEIDTEKFKNRNGQYSRDRIIREALTKFRATLVSEL
jgi:hypothetical protein